MLQKSLIQDLSTYVLLIPKPLISLSSVSANSEFNSLLVPCHNRTLHVYSRKPDEDTPDSLPEAKQHSPAPVIFPINHNEIRKKCIVVKEGLQVSNQLRWQIEEDTRLWPQCNLWYEVRQKRITGYNCGQKLRQKSRTPGLLKSVLYSKPLPVTIKWGQEHEAVAHEACIKNMQLIGHTTIVGGIYYLPTREMVWFILGIGLCRFCQQFFFEIGG